MSPTPSRSNVYDDLLEETGCCQHQVRLEIYNLVLLGNLSPNNVTKSSTFSLTCYATGVYHIEEVTVWTSHKRTGQVG